MVASRRWHGARSDFAWEQEALEFIRKSLPETPNYAGWQCFTFTAKSGHLREVDLFVAAPGGLYLVEIKSNPGRLTNQGNSWTFRGERTRTIDNPLPLTNQKSKELRNQLEWAASRLRLTMRVPFVEPAVFLSDPTLRSALDDVQRHKVYGRDGCETGLPRIVQDLLLRPPRSDRDRVSQRFLDRLPDLMAEIGIHRLRKHRKIGPWRLAPTALDTGPTWQDYLAENTALPGQHRRVRIYLSELGATAEDREFARRVARREYLVLQGIEHPGIQRALDFSDEHEAGPAILFPHQPDWLRLDHYMAEYGAGLDLETRVYLIRQLAEALDHAHRRHLYHRALAARSVWVQFHQGGRYPVVRIADWQAAHLTPTGSRRVTLSSHGEGSLAGHIDAAAQPYLAPEFGRPDADSVALDVFGLGALAYLIVTGTAPAETRAELLRILTERQGLTPSAVVDSVDPWIDELVRDATRAEVYDRLDSVQAVLRPLDRIEENLAAAAEEDPLTAIPGTVLDGWTVRRKLGSGSTARALLVERDGDSAVFKVALTEAAAERLGREAAVLRRLRDSRIVRLREGPREIGGRTVVLLDRAGRRTLADHIRADGRLTIENLERYGEDLFNAVEYLEGEGVWHRDIKPDNLAVRELPNRQTRLVLFDFSLADVGQKQVTAGTSGYLDPFLDSGGRRPVYDHAAEHYAVAVTLHEMASAEQPAWGDGVTEPRLLDPAETVPQLAEDRFDPEIREQLVAFFHTALQRDASKRHASLKEMRDAWRAIFSGLAEDRPLTTPATVHGEDDDSQAARDRAAEAAEAGTPLETAGLSPKARSIARELGVATVGELIKIPGRRIQRLRGVGVSPRNELLKRARDWRRKFKLAESATAAAQAERDARAQEQVPEPDAAGHTLDEVVDRLAPHNDSTESRALLRILALPNPDGTLSAIPPWAAQQVIADAVNTSQPHVATLLGRARERWAREPMLTAVRTELVELLAGAGWVMEVRELAVELLAHRGSTLSSPDARLALAGAVVRAAIETEENLDNPRLVKRRTGDTILVALVSEDDPAMPSDAQLLDYAQELGRCADVLAGRDPLPVTRTVVRELRAVNPPSGMPPLSDTRLVSLAAAASSQAGVTPRFELYPVDLEPVRAVRLAQVGTLLTRPITPVELRARVLARLPDLRDFPDHEHGLARVLRDAGYDTLTIDNGRYSVRFADRYSGSTGTRSSRRSSTGLSGLPTAPHVLDRLTAVGRRGGFLVVKADLRRAAAIPSALCGRPDLEVSCVDVSHAFVAALRDIRERRGSPDWTAILSADMPDAPLPARLGFGELATEAFAALDRDIRADTGVVLLHDAAPLARYTGGMQVLERLADAARDPAASPHGLWLVAPMADPREPARLDREIVSVTPGGGEEIALSQSCIDALSTNTDTTGRAS